MVSFPVTLSGRWLTQTTPLCQFCVAERMKTDFRFSTCDDQARW